MPERIEGCFFKLGKKEQQGEVTMHAADHGLHDRAAGMTFTVCKPPILSPPIVFSRARNPDGIFG